MAPERPLKGMPGRQWGREGRALGCVCVFSQASPTADEGLAIFAGRRQKWNWGEIDSFEVGSWNHAVSSK